MSDMLLPILIGLFVLTLVVLAATLLSRSPGENAARRLEEMALGPRPAPSDPKTGILLRPAQLGLSPSLPHFWNLSPLYRLYEQADVGLDPRRFLLIPIALGTLTAGCLIALQQPIPFIAAAPPVMALLPLVWLVHRKNKRIKQFVAQMPDALELVGRALRAGHGLASGLKVVAEEMPAPVSIEFGRVFEEQNLGIPLEDALRCLADRIPTMDVRFFATAVIIQRTTGGDLAEILDKIGRLIRERFQILGQVQALTAEGRLSGVVLLGLPPSLLAVTYILNPDYLSILFNDPVGTKMLAIAGVLQVVGAFAIKKIITIKV